MGSTLDSTDTQTLEVIDRLYDTYPNLEISLTFRVDLNC